MSVPSACPSICPFFSFAHLSRCFLGIGPLIYQHSGLVLETHMEEPNFLEKLMRKMGQIFFWNYWKFIWNFFWICSIIKVVIICYIPTLGWSGHRIFKSTISSEQIDETAWFFYDKLMIIKHIENFLGRHGQKWVWPVWSQYSKIGCVSRINR